MFFETVGAVLIGWVDEVYVDPQFTFSFIGFEWLQLLPGTGMYWVFSVLGLLAICIALGYRYRTACLLFLLGWLYVYIIHKTSYNNHHYLYALMILVMSFLPANAYKSLDVRFGRAKENLFCLRWHIWIFLGLFFVVYTYAAIAKLYPDWLAGIPMEIWFGYRTSDSFLASFYHAPYTPKLFAWGGIAFDFLVIPALMWKRTRVMAFCLSILFHIGNSITFQIGTFPYVMIAASVLFFPGEQIRRIFLKRKEAFQAIPNESQNQRWVSMVIILFFLIQLLLPLRQHLFSGNVFWTEEGHRLSWRMMLKAKSGAAYFTVQDLDGRIIEHDPNEYLTPAQFRTMSVHPDMIWQYCQFIKSLYDFKVQIYVRDYVEVNRNGKYLLIDEKYDMAKAEWHLFEHEEWITEFEGWEIE
jgi:hypothetical protein